MVLSCEREVARVLFSGDPLTKRHGNAAHAGDLTRHNPLAPPWHPHRGKTTATAHNELIPKVN